MGLIKKLVEREIDLYEAKSSAVSNPTVSLDKGEEQPLSIQAGRVRGGQQIKDLKAGLEDKMSVSVRKAGPNKWAINVSVQGSTLKLADVRRALRDDPASEGLSII